MEAMIQSGHDALPTKVPVNSALFFTNELVHSLAGSICYDREEMGVLSGIIRGLSGQ